MLQCCVCRLSVVCMECIVAKRYILEQKLLLTAYRKSYEKSIGTKMNDLDLCLQVVSRSRQPLRYIWRWISRKPLEMEAWLRRTTNRKWHGLSNGQVTDDVTWPPKVMWGSTVGYPSNSLTSCSLFTSNFQLTIRLQKFKYVCIVAKRYILEQKLLLTAYRKSYEKSIGTKMNDLDFCLQVVSRSL